MRPRSRLTRAENVTPQLRRVACARRGPRPQSDSFEEAGVLVALQSLLRGERPFGGPRWLWDAPLSR